MKKIIPNNNNDLYMAVPLHGKGKGITDICLWPIVAWLIRDYPDKGELKGFHNPVPISTEGVQLSDDCQYAIFNKATDEYSVQGAVSDTGRLKLIKWFDECNTVNFVE